MTATVLLVIGMAGSGKTTVMHRLITDLEARGKTAYVLNLDPAVQEDRGRAEDAKKNEQEEEEEEEDDDDGLPYEPNIDIRDSVNYRQVMQNYKLGPNGAILTCLNLYATKFDQVMKILEERAKEHDYILVDTPGQIEVFTWSASGQIITETISATLPTVLVYVVDTPRTTNPATFCSNMLYACSVMFKTSLPMLLVFNKIDVTPHQFALEWLTDFDALQTALDEERDAGEYMTSLTRSMALVLEEFYNTMRCVGISSATGEGMEQFWSEVPALLADEAREEEEGETG